MGCIPLAPAPRPAVNVDQDCSLRFRRGLVRLVKQARNLESIVRLETHNGRDHEILTSDGRVERVREAVGRGSEQAGVKIFRNTAVTRVERKCGVIGRNVTPRTNPSGIPVRAMGVKVEALRICTWACESSLTETARYFPPFE